MEKLFNTKNRDFSGKMGTQIVTYNTHQKSYSIVYFNENYMHMLRKAETNYQNK